MRKVLVIDVADDGYRGRLHELLRETHDEVLIIQPEDKLYKPHLLGELIDTFLFIKKNKRWIVREGLLNKSQHKYERIGK